MVVHSYLSIREVKARMWVQSQPEVYTKTFSWKGKDFFSIALAVVH